MMRPALGFRLAVLFLTATATSCLAAIGNFRVLGTTATQALLVYTAPDGNACTIQVSQSASLSPLALDVDPGTFANSNLDLSRPGTVTVGLSRAVLVGQRTAQYATAGAHAGVRHYSRALQAYTPYFGNITCPSTGDTQNFTFTTNNIPLGITYADPWLSDASHPGDQPYPETLGGTAQESFIDPLTGLLLVRIDLRSNDYSAFVTPPIPGSGSGVTFGTAYDQGQTPCDSGGNWMNPCSTLVSGGSGNTTIANSSGVLVLRPPLTASQSLPNGWQYYSSFWTLDQAQLRLTGSVSAGTDVVDICYSMNGGASCATAVKQATFGTSSSTQTAGVFDITQYGVDPWLLDSNPRINMQEIAPNSGTDTVSGNVVTWVSGSNNWSLYWTTGGNGRIRLSTSSAGDACAVPGTNSAEYTITGFTDGLHMTVTPTPPSGANWWCENNFAVMIWRDSPNSNTLTLTGATIAEIQGQSAFIPDNGASAGCLIPQVNGGFWCNFGGLFWINPANGQTAYYGQMTSLNPGITNNWNTVGTVDAGETNNIDQTQAALTFYFLSGVPGGNGGPLVIRGVFNPSTISTPATPYKNGNQIGNATINTSLTTPYSVTYTNGLTFTNMTPENSGGTCETMVCQLATFDPTFNTAVFGSPSSSQGGYNCSPYGESLSVLFISCLADNTDSFGWVIAFWPGNGNPALAGQPGGPQIIGAINTFNTPNGPVGPGQTALTGRSLHALAETGETGWIQLQMHWTPPINTTSTAIPASSSTTCASFGDTGNTNPCIQLQIVNHTSGSPCKTGCTGYEPYIASPQYQFAGAPGELRTVQIGDTVCVGGTSSCNVIGYNELMSLRMKGANGLWTFQRAINGSPTTANSGTPITLWWGSLNNTPITAYTAGNGLTAYWNPLAGCGGSPDPHGACLLQSINSNNGHGEWRDGGSAESVNVPVWNVLDWDSWPVAYQTSSGPVPGIFSLPFANDTPFQAVGTNYTSYSPPFAGTWGNPWANNGGTHPNPAGQSAPPNEAIRGFDNATFGGGSASGAQMSFVPVTGQLYVWTPSTVIGPDNVLGSALPSIDRKLMATAVSCGSHPVVDVSGPGSTIAANGTGAYTYCWARIGGECRPGSSVGQIYVNCPGMSTFSAGNAYCAGSALHGGVPFGEGADICVGNQGAANNTVRQFTLDRTDYAGAYARTLVTANSRVRMTYGFENNRMLPDNSWLLFRAEWLNYQRAGLFAAKMVPYPAPDSVARGSFVPVALTLKPPAGLAVDNAIVQFGYQEYGAPQSLNCTTRNDACLANASTVPAGNEPFYFASESPAGAACASGCTISVPAISQRILYYQVLYRAANNSVLASGPLTSTVVP